jgi:hypothetical protein
MIIDVKPSGKPEAPWVVIAHTESGDCYDYYQTQEKALEFALAFYGGTVVAIAPVTSESCQKYNSSWHSCNCPDFAIRGGSYRDENGQKACKHMLKKREEKACAKV